MQEDGRRQSPQLLVRKQSSKLLPFRVKLRGVAAPVPEYERERLRVLHSLKILDTSPEQAYDDLTRLAASLFRVPIVQISLIDADRQFIKSSMGLDRRDTPRELSFCAHAIAANSPLIVLDSITDPRFCDSPLVHCAPNIRFYAGVPLRVQNAMPIGTFCLIDHEPHPEFTEAEADSLQRFASLAAELIEMRLADRRIARAKHSLQETEERLALAATATSDGIWDLNCSTGELFYSHFFKQLLGIPEENKSLSVLDWIARIHPRDIDRLRNQWWQVQSAAETSFHTEMRCLHENGSWVWLMVRAACKRDERGDLLRVTAAASDITSRMTRDPLTSLFTRESLIDQLQWRIDKAELEPRNFALYFLNLDSFKLINDSMGHSTGNALLMQVADRLGATVLSTPGSIAARLGGDEFSLLVSDLATEADAATFAALLSHLMEAPFNCAGQLTYISASIGVAFGCATRKLTASQMLEEADIAMFCAKKQAPGLHLMFQSAMKAAAVERFSLERELRKAVDANQIEVYYQPKVNLDTSGLVGMEALVRWRHPSRGILTPNHFISIAEETGLINAIGDAVARQAITQLSRWIHLGIVDPQTTIAINISTKQIRQADLWHRLELMCEQAGLPKQNLIIEITESFFIEHSATAARMLQECIDSGFGLSLDDFGTGYSSLSYLHNLPFQDVKIDRSFISHMSTDHKSRNLVDSIIHLAAALDMGVIAEGIETIEQSIFLRNMGCNVGQGYLYSCPVPASVMEMRMREQVPGTLVHSA